MRPVLVAFLLLADAFVVGSLAIAHPHGGCRRSSPSALSFWAWSGSRPGRFGTVTTTIEGMRGGGGEGGLGWGNGRRSRYGGPHCGSAVHGRFPGEDVLVVCNPATEEIGALMRIEAQGDGADATLAVIPERDSHAAEPPRAVAAAMAAADVVLAPTIQSLSHTAARKAASEAGVRIGTLPGVTEEMLTRLMSADLDEIRRRGWASGRGLNGGSEVRITCATAATCDSASRGASDRRRRRTRATAAPSATCPVARASSLRSRAPARARWSSTARSPGSACWRRRSR